MPDRTPRIKPTDLEQVNTLHWVLDSGLIKDWRTAVDGGANDGFWSIVMAQKFRNVIAFEPNPTTFQTLLERTDGEVKCYNKALYNSPCKVRVVSKHKVYETEHKHSRGCFVLEDYGGDVDAIRLDSLNLDSCGLLKLDLEGAELRALIGAAETIDKYHPVIIIEISALSWKRHGHSKTDVVTWLKNHGYMLKYKDSPDCVFAYTGKK